MTGRVIRIERTEPRPGGAEEPYFSKGRGYKLGDPSHGESKKLKEHAVYEVDLQRVAELVEQQRFHLWMHRKGKRSSLISPEKLHIVRE